MRRFKLFVEDLSLGKTCLTVTPHYLSLVVITHELIRVTQKLQVMEVTGDAYEGVNDLRHERERRQVRDGVMKHCREDGANNCLLLVLSREQGNTVPL